MLRNQIQTHLSYFPLFFKFLFFLNVLFICIGVGEIIHNTKNTSAYLVIEFSLDLSSTMISSCDDRSILTNSQSRLLDHEKL